MAPVQGIGDVQRVAAELALRVFFNVAQLGHIGKVENRLTDLEPHRRIDLIDVEQIGLGTDERHQRHHNGFADRIDRWIGHLGEQLLEVVVERLVAIRQNCQWAVIAHRAQRLFACDGHGRNQELDVFLREAKGLLAIEQRHHTLGRRGRLAAALNVVKPDAQVLNPLLVGFAVGQSGLEFIVIDHAALLQIDQEHLARLQTPFAHDLVFRHRQHARLGRHDDQVIVRDAVTRRPQSVAVQRGADLAPVCKHDGGRAVPGFEHGGVVFIEGFATLVHGGVLLPGLRDHHHHGLADRVARHGQQFQAVIKGGGVGLPRERDRVELLQIGTQHRRGHHAFTRLHPVVVALDGIDLAVVRNITVRVRQRPLGEGVGRETLVHQAESRDATQVLQIAVVSTNLIGQQQALVDDGTARHAGYVVLLAVLELERLDVGAGGLADDVELALQRVLNDDVVAASNEDLADNRLLLAHRGRHRHVMVHRHVAPAQQYLAFELDGALHLLLASQARGVLLGQKDHAHAVFTRWRQGHALRRHLFAVERIGQLDQNAGAIAHQLVSTDRAPMVQILQNLERILDDVMRLGALDMGHKADATSVMLMVRRVQTVFLEMLRLCNRCHGAFLIMSERRRIPQRNKSAKQNNWGQIPIIC